MKKVAVSTWCTDDYVEYIGIENLTKSIKYFHPEIDHHISNGIENTDGIWMMAAIALEISDDYDMVIHLDGDTIVLGDLSEMISSKADIIGTLNNNSLSKAGANDGITTPLYLHNKKDEQYYSAEKDIPIDEWLNAGVIAANNSEFWLEWKRVNDVASSHGYRLPPPYGDENDTLNLVFHGGKFTTEIVDSHKTSVSYNIKSLSGNSHYESLKKFYVKDDKVYYDDFLTNEPIQIKVLHQGGGAHASSLVKESGGFYNWLKKSVPTEVKDFIEHITN